MTESGTALIYALSGDVGVLDPAVVDAVRRQGATSLQLNVSDVAVADAFRLSVLEPPADAFVTVFGDVAPGAITEILAETAETVRGWRVETEAPIPPRGTPDGERLDALANVAVLRRPEGIAEGEWLRLWKVEHTRVAIETQATFGYVQHRVLEPVVPGSPEVSAVVEEHFPMAAVTDLHAFYGSDGDQAELERRMQQMMTSIARFGADRDLDLVPTSRYRWDLG